MLRRLGRMSLPSDELVKLFATLCNNKVIILNTVGLLLTIIGVLLLFKRTSASSKPDPRLDPTRLRGAPSNGRPYRDLRNVALTRRDLPWSLPCVREKSLVRKCSVKPMSSPEITKNRHFRVRVLPPHP